MKSNDIDRREFLKLGAIGLGWLGSAPFGERAIQLFPQSGDREYATFVGRVTAEAINVYPEPSLQSVRVGKYHRDQLLNLLEEIVSEAGPPHNPRWYRVSNGYVYSARIQRIDRVRINTPLLQVPEGGLLGEISVPYSRSFYPTRSAGWQPLYRLYYRSLHWITGIESGPDGKSWYRLHDNLLNFDYHVHAAHLQPVWPEEFSPSGSRAAPLEKRIAVSIAEQSLTAYEGDLEVYRARISSGLPDPGAGEGEIPTDTPLGSFRIQLKMPSRHMGDGKLTDEVGAYELPGVPWTMVFHEVGVAFHGTYWHDNFGARMSHGCVNLRNEDALWLFRWTDPVYTGEDWYAMGNGTLVVIS